MPPPLSEPQMVRLEHALAELPRADKRAMRSIRQPLTASEIDAALADSDVSEDDDADESCRSDAAVVARGSMPTRASPSFVIEERVAVAASAIVVAQPLSDSDATSSDEEPEPPARRPPPAKKRLSRANTTASKKVPRLCKAKSRPSTPREVDASDPAVARVLASGPKPAAPSGWDIGKDAQLARLGIVDRAGIQQRLMEIDPSLPTAVANQYQRGIVAMFGFHTHAYHDLASLCAWHKAFASPNPQERTKQQAVADFIAAHYFPALGTRKLNVHGLTHKGYATWAEGLEACLEAFLGD